MPPPWTITENWQPERVAKSPLNLNHHVKLFKTTLKTAAAAKVSQLLPKQYWFFCFFVVEIRPQITMLKRIWFIAVFFTCKKIREAAVLSNDLAKLSCILFNSNCAAPINDLNLFTKYFHIFEYFPWAYALSSSCFVLYISFKHIAVHQLFKCFYVARNFMTVLYRELLPLLTASAWLQVIREVAWDFESEAKVASVRAVERKTKQKFLSVKYVKYEFEKNMWKKMDTKKKLKSWFETEVSFLIATAILIYFS